MHLPPNDVVIRALHKNDVETLVKTFCFPWSTIQATSEKWQMYYQEHQMQEHQTHARTVVLLELQDNIIGYASLVYHSQYPEFKNAGIPEIHDVWISETWRNKGYGKMLILHLEKMAHAKDYKHIGLGVGLYKDYGSAQRLYFSLGYTPDGKGITYKAVPVTPGATHPIDDDLILWLTKSLA